MNTFGDELEMVVGWSWNDLSFELKCDNSLFIFVKYDSKLNIKLLDF